MHILWQAGLLLRIQKYKFEDDGSQRDKYSIVLQVNKHEAYVIHTLTTSQNKAGLPANYAGCQVHKFVPYYFFPALHVVSDNGFYFEKDTYVFFSSNVRKEPLEKLEGLAKQSVFGLVPLGCLASEELKRLLKCLLKSNQLPQAIKEELESVKSGL